MALFASKLEATVLILSLVGFLFSGLRMLVALFTGKVRALVKFYSRSDDRVEYNVWLYTYLCLCITFLAILALFGVHAGSTTQDDGPSATSFYITLILVIQFSALIAFVPIMVRMMSTKSKTRGGDSKSMKQQLQQSTPSLQQAFELLSEDYLLESQESQMGVTLTTFSRKSNSSALIRIESREDKILEIY